jgi:hypothetical protein
VFLFLLTTLALNLVFLMTYLVLHFNFRSLLTTSSALPLRGTYTSTPGREAKPGKKRLRRGQEAFGPKSEISVRNSIF